MKKNPLNDKLARMRNLVKVTAEGSDSEQDQASDFTTSDKNVGSTPFASLFTGDNRLTSVMNATLKPSDIVVDSARQRRLTPVERARLKKSIKEDGLWSPITVEKTADGKYKIVAGHNRFDICTNDLEWQEIPVKIISITSSSAKAAFISNLLQPELSVAEIYMGFKILRSDAEGCRMDNKDIAAETGFSTAYVSQIMSLEDLSPRVINAMYQSKVIVGANSIRRLVAVFPVQSRNREMYDQITDLLVEYIEKAYQTLHGDQTNVPEEASLDAARNFWSKQINAFIDAAKSLDQRTTAKTQFNPYQSGKVSLARQDKSVVITFNFESEEDAVQGEKMLKKMAKRNSK